MIELKPSTHSNPRVCVIGAGPSGLAAIKNLQEQGLSNITAFEKNDRLGGNWVFTESESHSSVYETTHIISSKKWSQFEDFPMPDHYPDYPSHRLILEYFNSYADFFNLRHYISFNSTVLKVQQSADKKWLVQVQIGDTLNDLLFDYLLVANGHHWDPYVPQYKGSFSGTILHSHTYKRSQEFKNKRVLVVGGGNSACDLAVEISRISANTCISMRRGYHIIPKFIFGKPADEAMAKTLWMPAWLRQKLFGFVIRVLQGRYPKYKLPVPDCGLLEIHPTINSELLYFIRHGKVLPVPGIDFFKDNTVYFTDGSTKEFDVIIFATGYKISFPFLDKQIIDFSNVTSVPLYLKMIHAHLDNLYFIGLCQPQGCIWPLADHQSKIVSRIIKGTLKKPEQLTLKIKKEMEQPHYRFKAHTRHALEVDYHRFRAELLELLNQ